MANNTFKNFGVRAQDIVLDREDLNSVLIRMPEGSRYSGCTFWHPRKCLFEGLPKGSYIVSYASDSWEFRLCAEETDDSGRHPQVAALNGDEMAKEWKSISDHIKSKPRAPKSSPRAYGGLSADDAWLT